MIVEYVLSFADPWWSWALACLWSALPLYLCAELIVRFARWISPQIKHLILLVVLMNCVTYPLWTFTIPLYSLKETVGNQSPEKIALEQNSPQTEPVELDRIRQESSMRPAATSGRQPAPFHQIIFLIGLTGSMVLSIVIAVKLLQIAWRVRRSRRDERLTEVCASLCKRLGMKAPCVYVSNSNILPSAVGILSPCLIFPEQILRKNGHELTSIVAHELAHLKRRDCLVNWFQLTLTAAMWWNPIVARVNHLLRCEMEHCCDDFVLRATGISPYRYSTVLLDVAKEHVQNRIHGWIPAFAPPKHTINERIRRITMFNATKKRYSIRSISILVSFILASLVGFQTVRAQQDIVINGTGFGTIPVEEISKQIEMLETLLEAKKKQDPKIQSKEMQKALHEFTTALNNLGEAILIEDKITRGLIKDKEDLINKEKTLKIQILEAYRNDKQKEAEQYEKEYVELMLPQIVDPAFLGDEDLVERMNKPGAFMRDLIGRTYAEIRSLKCAIEAIHIDYKKLPIPIEGNRIDQAGIKTEWEGKKITARINDPIMYISSIPTDPFDLSGAYYAYFSDGKTYILSSMGPDGDFDYDVSKYKGESLEELKPYIFNIENGFASSGDIIVVGP